MFLRVHSHVVPFDYKHLHLRAFLNEAQCAFYKKAADSSFSNQQ